MKTLFLIALAIVFGKPVHAQIQHDFSPNRNIISCGANNVYFVYNKAVTPDLISWDFGDGGTSMLINPVHYYSNPGVYTVKLFITKNNICDTVIKHNFITILSKPEANFNITRIPSEPFKIELTSTSQHHADSFLYQHWLMGNDTICRTHKMDISFTRNGKYNIKLEVANNNNCKSSIDTTITVDVPELEPVGLNELNTQSHQVFPNPTNGSINLNIPTESKLIKLTLINSNAQHKQIEAKQNGEQWIADLSGVDAGIYFLIIDTEKEKFSTKVFVNP
jgi:PKD repeat protein